MYTIRIFSLLAALTAFTAPASATLLFSDDFESDTTALGVTELVNWNVVQGNVDVIACATSGTGNCVDLDGTGSPQPARIELRTPVIISIPGTYLLSFAMPEGNENDSFMVSVGNFFSQMFSGYSFPLSRTISIAVAPEIIEIGTAITDTVRIAFESLADPNDRGPFLTAVSLERIDVIPEPLTLALLAVGAVGLLAARAAGRA